MFTHPKASILIGSAKVVSILGSTFSGSTEEKGALWEEEEELAKPLTHSS